MKMIYILGLLLSFNSPVHIALIFTSVANLLLYGIASTRGQFISNINYHHVFNILSCKLLDALMSSFCVTHVHDTSMCVGVYFL